MPMLWYRLIATQTIPVGVVVVFLSSNREIHGAGKKLFRITSIEYKLHLSNACSVGAMHCTIPLRDATDWFMKNANQRLKRRMLTLVRWLWLGLRLLSQMIDTPYDFRLLQHSGNLFWVGNGPFSILCRDLVTLLQRCWHHDGNDNCSWRNTLVDDVMSNWSGAGMQNMMWNFHICLLLIFHS